MLFAFQYGRSPWLLAVVPADPADRRITIPELPPGMHWRSPAWAPDGSHFVAISNCAQDACHEDARGSNVWRLTPTSGPEPGRLERLTVDWDGIARDLPFFGRTASELYWVVKSTASKGTRVDMNDRFIAHAIGAAQREGIVFPDDPRVLGNWITSEKLHLFSLAPAGAYDGRNLYFIGMVGRGTLPAARALAARKGRYDPLLMRWRGGDAVEIVRDVPAAGVDASRTGVGYVSVTRSLPYGHRPSEIEVVRDGAAELCLRFERGFAYDVSASDSLDVLVFRGERTFRGEESLWLHRRGWAEAADLDIPERVRAEVERQSSDARRR